MGNQFLAGFGTAGAMFVIMPLVVLGFIKLSEIIKKKGKTDGTE